jgi:hypothetical protein
MGLPSVNGNPVGLTVGADSVGTIQVIDESLTGADILDGSIAAIDLAPGAGFDPNASQTITAPWVFEDTIEVQNGIVWSDGVNPADTNLYRDSAGVLRTGGSLFTDSAVTVGTSGSIGFSGGPNITRVSSSIASLGTSTWRAGDYEISANGAFEKIQSTNEFGALIQTKLSTDSQNRFRVDGNGTVTWGPGGVTSPDTNLYRDSADLLKTDDSLWVSVNLIVEGDATIGGSAGNSIGFYGDDGAPQASAIPDASGGATVDTEARAAINALLAALRATTGVGLIAG